MPSQHLCLLVFYYSYYMDGRIKKVEDFLKTRLLDTLTQQLSKVTKVHDCYTPTLQFTLIVNVNEIDAF